jgi:hypothetical protein
MCKLLVLLGFNVDVSTSTQKNSELCFQNGDLIRFFEIGENSSENGKHFSKN